MIGKTILHYNILEELGRGGRASSTKYNTRLHCDGGRAAKEVSFVHFLSYFCSERSMG